MFTGTKKSLDNSLDLIPLISTYKQMCCSHIQCIWTVFTASHLFHILSCCILIPKWVKFIFQLKILHPLPHIDKVKMFAWSSCNLKKKKKEKQKYNTYIRIHSFCHDTQNWDQVHPVSTDHLSGVPTSWSESTCGKFSFWDMIWKDTYLSIFVRAQTKPWKPWNRL